VAGTHTRDTGVAPYPLRFQQLLSAWFLLSELRTKTKNIIEMWPIGGLVGFWQPILQFYMQAVLAGAFSAPFHTLKGKGR
jgi:hypothetical protein